MCSEFITTLMPKPCFFTSYPQPRTEHREVLRRPIAAKCWSPLTEDVGSRTPYQPGQVLCKLFCNRSLPASVSIPFLYHRVHLSSCFLRSPCLLQLLLLPIRSISFHKSLALLYLFGICFFEDLN